MTNNGQSDSPIFICGVGRSGTSLLQSMLNAHPDISFPPETRFFRKYLRYKNKRNRYELHGLSEFVRILDSDLEFERCGLRASEVFLSDVEDPEAPFCLQEAYLRFLGAYAEKESAHHFGDKDPRLLENLKELSKLFPDAAIIHIIRDPRDVLVSKLKAAWSHARPWWLHVLIYRAQLNLGRRDGREFYRDRYIEVFYEDLITSPEETLTRVTQHIGVTFVSEMLEFSQAAQKIVSEHEMQWKSETLGPLLSENMGKWRSTLSPLQVRFTEVVCRESFAEDGYKEACETNSPFAGKPLLVLPTIALSRIFNMLYRFRI